MNAQHQPFTRGASKRTVEGANSRQQHGLLARWARSAIVSVAARLVVILALALPAISTPALAQTQPPPTPEPTLAPDGAFPQEVVPQDSAPVVSAENEPVEAQAGADDWPMYMHDAGHSTRTAAQPPAGSTYYLQWAYSFGERVEVEAQPVTVAGVIYQGVMNGEMHAINALTGKKIWIARPGGPIPHTAAVTDGRVFFGSLDGRVYALDAVSGATQWIFRTGAPVLSAPAVVNGVVYIGSTDTNLYAIDAASGVERWRVETGGPVVSSPAVANGRVFFGSEDLKARAVDAASGALLWATQLYGQGMHNTHPVVSDDGQVTIWVTVKPGASSYVPIEPYPEADVNANPVDTWDAYYSARPRTRPLYYLSASSGADLWQPGSRRYTPLPIPYWGLLAPALTADGSAVFPAPSGARGYAFELDHDNRLFKVNLASGETSVIAGGPGRPEYQARSDESGRFIVAGSDYLYSSSEDLAVFHMGSSGVATLYGDGQAGFYNIGSHMAPLSPLPSRHLWRYGGAVAMGGMPGGSVPIVANNMVYYSAYSWLYAVGPTNKNLKPATSFPARNARLSELTYPQLDARSTAEIRAEMERRIEDILARGPENPPMAVRWEQPGGPMRNNETVFEVYGMDYDLVRSLAEAYPFVNPDLQARLKVYLTALAKRTILDPQDYAYVNACLYYGESSVRVGDDQCKDTSRLMVRWNNDNPNLFGQRMYAIWAYANATGDWDSVRTLWQPVILPHLKQFIDAYNASYGFARFPEWRVGRLNIGAQIEAAQAVRDMAVKLGDTTSKSRAQTLLNNLLNGRVTIASFVSKLYSAGKRKSAPIRLNSDGTLRYDDIMGPASPYNAEMIPYSASVRNASTDPSQLNWREGSAYQVDAGAGFMHYQAMSGYFPMSSEMAARLRSRLLTKTDYYVKSYEVNNPWWWMADLAHSTTGSGEHLYHSPTLSWTMFQVKARVQKLSFDALVRQLPEPTSFNYRYDLYRLQNLVTLLDVCRLQSCKR